MIEEATGIAPESETSGSKEQVEPQTPTQLSDAIDANEAFARLRTKYLKYLLPPSDVVLEKAFRFADGLHAGQRRKSGEPYIIHPLAVAEILTEFRMDETSLAAAILHDVVEDTHVSVKEVEDVFGAQVANLVDGLTKLARVTFRSSQEKLAENFRKMVVAMSRDIRVIIVKLADRTHNMRTLKALDLEKRQRIAEETLEIYAPLAGRLGIYRIKAELEDLCLKELKPSVYFSLVSRVSQKKGERERFIEGIRTQIELKLAESNMKPIVEGRAKHFYSIYKKMTDKQMDFEDIYDLFGVRVLVETVNECYEALGAIHNQFKPVPGRFKDYIAMPKANLYQSLHTTVLAARGELLEVQIRTSEMHGFCEMGIAAHWAYKEKRRDSTGPLGQDDLEKFNWLKQMVKHQHELTDADEFLEAVKVDLFDDEVYVFSPKGDVFEVQRGATALDFAFAVHSDLGLRVTGAKINGRICTLRTTLSSGDVVEILTASKVRASKDWLSIVTTSKARSKIRAWLRSEEREEAKSHGQEQLQSALEKLGTSIERMQKSGALQDVNRLFHVGGLEDLILQIGYGKLDSVQAAQKLVGILPQDSSSSSDLSHALSMGIADPRTGRIKTKTRCSRSAEESVRVQEMDGILVRLAKCCEPLPGQPIVGFVSRGRGVTVHSANCEWALTTDPARRVECSWNTDTRGEHNVRLRITTHDKQGLLANITKTISQAGHDITGAEVQTTPDRRGIIIMKVRVGSIRELKDLHQKLEGLDGVICVERLTG
jgi:guanosine-3',5'-bis(diphosphate) 3'-pyrophosphohydrolase